MPTFSTTAPDRRRARRKLLMHAGFALFGAGALAAMIHHVGAGALYAILGGCVAWLPVLLLLEAVRIGGDTGATWLLYRRWGRRVPTSELVRAQLVAYPVSIMMPAGRAASEALKANVLARFVGGPRAAAVATMNQSLALFGGALVSLPCLVASLWLTGASLLSLGIAIQATVSFGAGVLLQLAVRGKRVGGFLGKRFAQRGDVAADYQAALADHPVVPLRPLAAMAVNRTAQVLQYAAIVLAIAGTTGVGQVLLAQGINMVGTSLGDLIPGQIGATDGAFALGASALGITAANAIAISILAHFVQMCWVLAGTLVPIAWRPAASREPVAAREPAPVREPTPELVDAESV
jgi:hypothetical protein